MESIRARLPEYYYIYLGDNARSPYGTRSFDVVHQYTLQCVKRLFELDCELIILACNTASAKALRTIQQKQLPLHYPQRRVLGVIRPTVEAVQDFTITNHVGLVATTGTILSESYPLEIAKLFPHIKVVGQACPMWVPLIENNEHLKPGADYFVKEYLQQLFQKDAHIDTLILGCTHYPLLRSKIEEYLPQGIKIILQGDIVAESLANYLEHHPELEQLCTKQGTATYYTTERPEKFHTNASLFMKHPIVAHHINLD